MSVKVYLAELKLPFFTVSAMAFIPETQKAEWALCSHGYTSHKGDCLNWATRLSEAGIPTLIFDLPGHYLGSFHEAKNLEDFKHHAHELFYQGFLKLKELLRNQNCDHLILAGHSLGGLLAMKALADKQLANQKKLAVGIGIGIGQHQATHLFETAFYQKTLNIRRQLVSPALDAAQVFAWIKTEKEHLTVKDQRIHLITGQDDIVVGAGGVEAMVKVLEENQNTVTIERPVKLAHHEPQLAAPHLYAFLKNHFGWK